MINNVVLVGRMTRDAELRYTPSNQAVATFTLAVNRNFKNQNGEREADFINVVIWRQQAENLANWAKKGALVGITGRIQTRNYENQQGQRVYVTEVVADNFQLLESRTAREGQGGGYQAGNSFAGGSDYNSPYQAPAQSTPNFARDESPFGTTNPMDISDDDLPF
ncbi:single-stranded DNA-binding protein [Streptococcus azizii]|uniref:Single-stranded DNA-binding protein n=1 Tax=Streptococcus azizii TaxID=1579424 RepID=A0AB36JRI7_9STRE|nr:MULTISPECIES: single-stranded DNA-binding protein [Streptococcus]MBF0776233.1 single-stranded DNA-binding protein [Streptococcus sp. 19428wD3_AN2]ONK28091.1 single-stranded DNA-binding protein [Streptococcus azizii]ONK30489.1 single-stranded DNA-binding protein [Streptococcus azizii]ONK31032.1 single-stranded DNA-binding protein [Streptococcus azizii]TFU83363.1 single-stranded DNA-binding protein [Streptococcus sp. AN2]